jgi:hypothetical protein
MPPATANQGTARQAKRVRTDPMATNSGDNNNTTKRKPGQRSSPSQAAMIALETQSESHHPAIASICLPVAKAIQQLRYKAQRKKGILKKMEEEVDYIPHSLRLNVALQHSEEALDMMTEQEKEHITNQMTAVTEACKTSGKVVIITSNKIDLKAFHWKIKSLTVELIHNATSTFITAEGIEGTTEQDIHNKAWQIIHHHGDHLFKHHNEGTVYIQQAYIDN